MQWKVPRGVTRVKSSSGCLTRFLVRIPLIILSLSLLSTAYRNPKTKAWNLQVPRSCDGGLICDAHCSLERQGKRNEFSLFAMVAGVNQARRLDPLPSCWNSDSTSIQRMKLFAELSWQDILQPISEIACSLLSGTKLPVG